MRPVNATRPLRAGGKNVWGQCALHRLCSAMPVRGKFVGGSWTGLATISIDDDQQRRVADIAVFDFGLM